MRNSTIDLARLIASFFIVAVHVGYYTDYSPYVGDVFRSSARWALPLFFLITGYFIGVSKDENFPKRVNKILGIFITSSIIFIPYAILKKVEQGAVSLVQILPSILSVDSLLYGDYFHLWFLPALIIGMLLAKFAIDNIKPNIALWLSGLLLLLTWLSDLYAFFDKGESYFYFFRVLVSFPLVYIGYYLARNPLSITREWSAIIFLGSVVLMVFEVSFLTKVTGHDGLERQFPLFCALAATMLLCWCVKAKVPENFFSRMGERYSLGIYLFHPIFLPITKILLTKTLGYDSFIHLILTFISTVGSMIILDKAFPKLFRFVSGGYIK